MSAVDETPKAAPDAPRGLRIGEAATLVGTTPRTIRYYEELGLLRPDSSRDSGKHRLYGEAEVSQLRDALRLKELLGLTLDELKVVVHAEAERADMRDEWYDATDERQLEIIAAATAHLDRQLALVTRRRKDIDALERDLRGRRALLLQRKTDIDGQAKA